MRTAKINRLSLVAKSASVVTTLLLVTVFASGCYQSEFAVDPAPQADADANALGTWRCVGPDKSDDAFTLTVERPNDRRYRVTMQESNKEVEAYEAYVSVVNGTHIVNVKNPAEKHKPWVFARFTVLQSKALLVELVQERLLKGVAATPVALRTVIERELLNPALFDDPMVCIRMTP
jgi:hypothetical protein